MTPTLTPLDLSNLFESVEDPRNANVVFQLKDVLTMAFIAIVAGMKDFQEMEQFCALRLKHFKQFLDIPRVPSHDTFERILSLINHAKMEGLFRQLMHSTLNPSCFGPTQVALDGKAQTNSHLHTVTAFQTQMGLSLASQETGKGKSNELATMIELIQSLQLKGCVVTTDAMGCNEKLFEALTLKKADYMVQLKANQKNALDSVQTFFNTSKQAPDWTEELTKERTGGVSRETFVHSNLKDFPFLEFSGLKSIVKIQKTITSKTGVKIETRYFLSSLTHPQAIATSQRAHWGIENRLHWVLDVQFHEDASRTREKTSQQNLGVLRKLAINALRARGISKMKAHQFQVSHDENVLIRELKQLFC